LACHQVVLMPHNADQTPERMELLNAGVVETVIAFLQGRPRNRVVCATARPTAEKAALSSLGRTKDRNFLPIGKPKAGAWVDTPSFTGRPDAPHEGQSAGALRFCAGCGRWA
jgi:hypothetical protein